MRRRQNGGTLAECKKGSTGQQNQPPCKNGSTIIISDDESEQESIAESSLDSSMDYGDNEIDRSAELFNTPCTKSPQTSFQRSSNGCKGVASDSSPWTNQVKKLKTFKTYGKVGWNKRRKSSAEWETARKINPTTEWDDCVNSRPDEGEEKDAIQDEKPPQNDPESLFEGNSALLTPCRPYPEERSATTHSPVFTTSTPSVFNHSPSSTLNNTDRKLAFHRSISFSNSPMAPNASSSSLKNVKALAMSSLLLEKSCHSNVEIDDSQHVSLEKQILDLCDQEAVAGFSDYVAESMFLRKIGEGSYGEVYERKHGRTSIIVKIVPVGSEEVLVHGIQQMSYEEIITEMSISKTLSDLISSTLSDLKHCKNENICAVTSGFIHLHKLLYCEGAYPQKLVNLWQRWDKERTSENDNPKQLPEDQKYILFETDYCGVDLESFTVNDEAAAWSILRQVIAALAVAEMSYQFEHRDLHWGNLLIAETEEETFDYYFSDGQFYSVDSCGLRVTIIDFTLSRIESDACVVFTNLSEEEELFTGKGDIQFNVYRDMREHNKNDWETFNPYTNVLWVHYLAQKLIEKTSSRRSSLNVFMRQVLGFSSAYEILLSGELD